MERDEWLKVHDTTVSQQVKDKCAGHQLSNVEFRTEGDRIQKQSKYMKEFLYNFQIRKRLFVVGILLSFRTCCSVGKASPDDGFPADGVEIVAQSIAFRLVQLLGLVKSRVFVFFFFSGSLQVFRLFCSVIVCQANITLNPETRYQLPGTST